MKKVLVKPIITEKSMILASHGVFSFEVAKLMSKTQISEAVEKLFKVHVEKVTTSTVKGGTRRVGKTRREILNKSQKTARVTLKKGEKIDLFDIKEQNA